MCKVFTISSGKVFEGAKIKNFQLKNTDVTIQIISVGEEGRNRQLGIVPIGNPPMVPCPKRNQDVWTWDSVCEQCGSELGPDKGGQKHDHPDKGMVPGILRYAEIGTTKAGKPKLFAKTEATTDDKIIVILETKIGSRGGNSHSGDQIGEEFFPFPGEVLAKGLIAEGEAGRCGQGEQLIALVPKNQVFRTSYSGRLYGAPDSHYYMWDGEKLLVATEEERSVSDIF